MPLTILYVEDNKIVADAVHDLLEGEGWRVELCSDGNSAMNRIAGGFSYDLLLFDNDLPGASGMELTRYARGLLSYSRTPIIMLSANESERGASRGRGLVSEEARRHRRAGWSRPAVDRIVRRARGGEVRSKR
jgi:CheY-like chemotaxis protein